MKILHTPFIVQTICKNGSEKYGANASCSFWYDGVSNRIDISQWGETKSIAENKLMTFLSQDGQNELSIIEKAKN